MKIKIQLKKLSKDAIMPSGGSIGAAGYDLYSTEDYTLKPGERKLFKTNISINIPHGYYGRIAPRSGLAFKNGIDVFGGVIDSDYRGDVGVILYNSDKALSIINESTTCWTQIEGKSLEVKKGDRIAQIIIEKYHDVEFEEVENLDETARAEKGWGSTGS